MLGPAEVTTPVLLDEKEVRTLLVNYMDHVEEYGHYGLTDIEFQIIVTKLRAALMQLRPDLVQIRNADLQKL